ncbi:MAG: cytochrome P450, partial [Microbacteriaceae bacterium]
MTSSPFSIRRTDPYSPPEEHRRLQHEEPVARVESAEQRRHIWTIAKHEDVRAVLGDTRFSSDRSNPHHPAHMAYNPGTHAGALIEMDPPEHGIVRGRVMNEFTVKKVAAMRPRVEEVVTTTIDAMLASGTSGDLVELLSLPVPSTVIAELLGVPYQDHRFFQDNSAKFTEHEAPQEEKVAAIQALRSYIAGLVDDRLQSPGEDILSRQIAAGASREEAIGLGFLLLIAGHETTANMISLSIMTLLDKPDLLQQLRDRPELLPGAVEELLRYFTIAGESGGLRLAVDD